MKASYDKALGVIAKGCGLKPAPGSGPGQALVRAIVQVESSGNPRAVRYEPAFYERYVKDSKYPQEEHRLLASSLGLLQAMGLVAREHGFCGPLEQLFIPEVNLLYGCLHLARFQAKYATLEEVIASFNAGSPRKGPDGKYVNWAYVDKVLKTLKMLEQDLKAGGKSV